MLNYIYADFYRIFRKKSFYAFLAICSLGFSAVIFIANSRDFNINAYATVIQVMMSMVPLFIGSYVFNIVYTDDLRSKSLQTAIGFGKKRSEIVLVKFLDATILMILLGLVMLAHILIVPVILNFTVTDVHRTFFLSSITTEVIKTLGFFAIASVAVYFYQKTTAATTVYILLATGTVSSLLSLLLSQGFVVDIVGNLQPYLYSNVVGSLSVWLQMGEGNILTILIQLAVYIVGASALAAAAFNHKELEF